MEWYNEVIQIIEKVRLSERNREFKMLIQSPWGFTSSKPKKHNAAKESNDGETKWQRDLYNGEERWIDIELPIGQNRNEKGKLCPKRVDLIGEEDGRYIICELKKTKGAEEPFGAIIQLLAYYRMITCNAETLDDKAIYHTNRKRDFKWVDVAKNPILMLRANKEYWENWVKSTPKNRAAKEILNICAKHGLEILLIKESEQISRTPHNSVV